MGTETDDNQNKENGKTEKHLIQRNDLTTGYRKTQMQTKYNTSRIHIAKKV